MSKRERPFLCNFENRAKNAKVLRCQCAQIFAVLLWKPFKFHVLVKKYEITSCNFRKIALCFGYEND